MIPIDTVYQRVLALANKEQRGYITPLEFNLLANQAQEIVFEQYFYDLNQAKRDDSDITSFSDMEELIQNKLAPFKSVQNVIGNTNFPTNYRTGKIFVQDFEAKKGELEGSYDEGSVNIEFDFSEFDKLINCCFNCSLERPSFLYRKGRFSPCSVGPTLIFAISSASNS